MRVWLDGAIRATAVLPLDGKLFPETHDIVLNHAGKVVFYRWLRENAEPVLRLDRDGVAADAELYRHSGTIHSLLHFVWYCGFKRVVFIGCDGLNDPGLLGSVHHTPTGYDPRIENRSRTAPWWQYDVIRRIQDQLCALLGLQAQYVGTPRPSGVAATREFVQINP